MANNGRSVGDDTLDNIDITLSDSDDDDFFTVQYVPKPKAAAPSKPAPRKRTPTPPPAKANEDGEEDEDSSPRKRKRKPAQSKGVELPEWTRRLAEEREEKERARERQRRKGSRQPSVPKAEKKAEKAQADDNVISLLSSDDDEPVQSKKTKGKGKAPATPRPSARRASPELTPPPPTAPGKRALVRKHIEEFMEETAEEAFRELAESTESGQGGSFQPSTSKRRSAADSGPKVSIAFNMVSDPDRKGTASQHAVNHYEKMRKIVLGRDEPLQLLADTIADVLGKRAQDLVFVHDTRRIFALSQTPADLHIWDEAEMKGYEKHVWEKISKQEREARDRLLALTDVDDADATLGEIDPGEAGAAAASEDDADDDTIKLKLRGVAGELNLSTTRDKPIRTILAYYCHKFKLSTDPAGMWLSFDGEKFQGDQTLGELDADDGDLVDVGGA